MTYYPGAHFSKSDEPTFIQFACLPPIKSSWPTTRMLLSIKLTEDWPRDQMIHLGAMRCRGHISCLVGSPSLVEWWARREGENHVLMRNKWTIFIRSSIQAIGTIARHYVPLATGSFCILHCETRFPSCIDCVCQTNQQRASFCICMCEALLVPPGTSHEHQVLIKSLTAKTCSSSPVRTSSSRAIRSKAWIPTCGWAED